MRIFLALAIWVVAFQVLIAQQAPPAKPAVRQRPSLLDQGTLADNVYRNSSLGFTYKFRFGWVDRTTQMRSDPDEARGGQVLLAVFERPPEVAGESVNSAVTIAAENVSSYPGLKTAADYFGPVTELTSGMGLKATGDPYDVTIGGRQLVRGDYKKEIGTLTMHWTSLAMVAKGHVVSFTFVASSEDEMEELIGRLNFGSAKPR